MYKTTGDRFQEAINDLAKEATNAIATVYDMVVALAQRTLSAKEFMEFMEELKRKRDEKKKGDDSEKDIG